MNGSSVILAQPFVAKLFGFGTWFDFDFVVRSQPCKYGQSMHLSIWRWPWREFVVRTSSYDPSWELELGWAREIPPNASKEEAKQEQTANNTNTHFDFTAPCRFFIVSSPPLHFREWYIDWQLRVEELPFPRRFFWSIYFASVWCAFLVYLHRSRRVGGRQVAELRVSWKVILEQKHAQTSSLVVDTTLSSTAASRLELNVSGGTVFEKRIRKQTTFIETTCGGTSLLSWRIAFVREDGKEE